MKNYHPEDILETALNKGINRAATIYNIDPEEVRSIVLKFRDEMEDSLCMCEQSEKDGQVMMCFACSGPIGRRIFV